MTRNISHLSQIWAGVTRPSAGAASPQTLALATVLGCALLAAGCANQEQDRNLEPAQVGLTPDVAPIFDDGETQLFEVKRGLQFPIVQPDPESAAALESASVEPYAHKPWVTNQDVKVQLSWTLSNLDDKEHVVELLIDPWNEFGRYYPGMQLTNAENQEFKPNSSGIDDYYVLDGKGAGDSSRRHGTFTFDDMNEMAIDFATVQQLIYDVSIGNPPPLPGGVRPDPGVMVDPLPTYANHAFNFLNRSYNDRLIAPYIPPVIAGLTGIDFGFRISADPNENPPKRTIALDIQIEIVDLGRDRVQKAGSSQVLLPPTDQVVTVGSPVPAK